MMESEPPQEHLAPPWDLLDLIKAGILAIVLMVLGVLTILGVGLILRLAGLPAPSRVVVAVATVIAQSIGFMASVWVFALRKHRRGLGSLGLRSYAAQQGCAYTIAAFVLVLFFNAVYSLLMSEATGRPVRPTPVLPIFGGGLAGLAVALFLGSLVAPLVEEVFFRGFVFAGLARRFGVAVGVLASSLLFASAHLNADTVIPLSAFGAVLALLYHLTGSLWPSIVLHSVNNSLALLAAFLMESGVLPAP